MVFLTDTGLCMGASYAQPRQEYTLGSEIGRGGNGAVYELLCNGAVTTYCVKRLHPRIDVAELRHEANMANSVQHHAILQCNVDYDTLGEPVLVMHRALHSLADRFDQLPKRKCLRLSALLAVFVELADAISAAHARGVLHRDIKPGNILFYDGLYRLSDWGLAKFVESDTNTARAGTPAFRAPEVLTGQYNTPADIFSFGMTLRCTLQYANADPRLTVMLEQLVANMTAEDPPQRPTARQVLLRLYDLSHRCVDTRFRAKETELSELDASIHIAQSQLDQLVARRIAIAVAVDREAAQVVLAFEDLKPWLDLSGPSDTNAATSHPSPDAAAAAVMRGST